MAEKARRHPVARCPRCGQKRRVEQAKDKPVYVFMDHKKGTGFDSIPCKGSQQPITTSQILR